MRRLSQSQLQRKIIKELKYDADFIALCVAEFGAELNYYLDTDVQNYVINNESYPALSLFKFSDIDINSSEDDEYRLQYNLGQVYVDEEYLTDADGIKYLASSESLEKVAVLIGELINESLKQGIITDDTRPMEIVFPKVESIMKIHTQKGEFGDEMRVIGTIDFSVINYLKD